MTPEEFKKLYTDTHLELKVTDVLEKGSFEKGAVIKRSPGDKNIQKYGKIPGKALIESQAIEERAKGLRHCIMDAISAKIPELMKVKVETLVSLAIKATPQQIDQKIDHSFSFADMARKAYGEQEIKKAEVVE